jgi:hypothetical protein
MDKIEKKEWRKREREKGKTCLKEKEIDREKTCLNEKEQERARKEAKG